MTRGRLAGLLLPPAGWLLLFLLVPAGFIVVAAFEGGGLEVLGTASTFGLVRRSLVMAVLSTMLCLLLGYPLAWFIAGCRPRARNLLLFLVVLPFWTNLLVRTYALLFLLRPFEWHHTPGAVLLGITHNFLPFMVLPLYGSIERLPRSLLEAAQNLGASPARAFVKVALPLTAPGIAAGCILVFIPALGTFAIPELLGGASVRMIGSQIDHCFRHRDPAAGAALTLLLIAVTLGLTWVYHRLRRTGGIV
ncbi:MAG: ABC transporter permease [Planctomycetes bacterium]|jgi:spermidine/putrescine transport system permease protein|nr:ABC transporter permease [Planctomycetota bacterium]